MSLNFNYFFIALIHLSFHRENTLKVNLDILNSMKDSLRDHVIPKHQTRSVQILFLLLLCLFVLIVMKAIGKRMMA